MAAKSARASSSARSRPWKPSGPMQLISSITPRQRSRKRTGMATMDCVSMMVRRTWSSWRDEVSALPSSWKTATSPASRWFTFTAELRRRSTPLKLLVSSTVRLNLHPLVRPRPRARWGAIAIISNVLCGAQPAVTARFRKAQSQLVQAVQRGHLISLSKSGVVEDRVAEIFDRGAQGQHRLADVDNLRGARADDMNAQKLEALGIEQELQQALLITEHLALGQLGVLGDARLVGYFRRGQLLLGLTDHRDFGDCIDAERQQLWGVTERSAEHVATSQPPLLHRRAGQRGEADNVPRRVDVGNIGLEERVNFQPPARIDSEPRFFRIQQIGVDLTANGGDQHFTAHPLAARRLGKDPITLLLDAYCDYLLAEPECGSKIAQVVVESFHDLTVHKVQEARALIDERDLDAHHRKKGGVLHADHPSAHHNCLPRQPLKRVKLISVQDPFAVEWNIGTMGRAGSAGNQDVITSEESQAAIGHHLDRMGVNEACGAFKRDHFVAFQLRPDDLGFPSHHSLNAESQVLHRHVLFQGVVSPVEGSQLEAAKIQDRFTQGLARNGAGMDAHAPDHAFTFDDGHTLPHFGGTDGSLLARGTASNHNQVELLGVHAFPRGAKQPMALVSARAGYTVVAARLPMFPRILSWGNLNLNPSELTN